MKFSRVLVALGGAALLLTALAPPGAGASSPHATLGVKGLGSVYSIGDSDGSNPATTTAVAVESVAKGGVAQFELLVSNSLPATSFRIGLSVRHDDPSQIPSTPAVYSSAVLGAKLLPSGPDGFVTPTIAADTAASYSVRVPVPASSPSGHVWVDVTLSRSSGVVEDHAVLIAEQHAAKGTTAFDVFAKQGSQALVGSPQYEAIVASPAQPNFDSPMYFSVKVQNSSAVRRSVHVRAELVNTPCVSVSIVQGTKDLTTQLEGSGFVTSALAPHGGSQSYTVKVTWVRGIHCEPSTIRFTAFDPGSSAFHSVLLLAPFGN